MALCDDIIDYNKKMESYIEKYGNENHVEVKITSYGSGSQLLLNYQKRKFDVIFLDVSMPEMDGFETAEEIRKSDTDVSIVFCTSYYTITNAGKVLMEMRKPIIKTERGLMVLEVILILLKTVCISKNTRREPSNIFRQHMLLHRIIMGKHLNLFAI